MSWPVTTKLGASISVLWKYCMFASWARCWKTSLSFADLSQKPFGVSSMMEGCSAPSSAGAPPPETVSVTFSVAAETAFMKLSESPGSDPDFSETGSVIAGAAGAGVVDSARSTGDASSVSGSSRGLVNPSISGVPSSSAVPEAGPASATALPSSFAGGSAVGAGKEYSIKLEVSSKSAAAMVPDSGVPEPPFSRTSPAESARIPAPIRVERVLILMK